MGPQNVDGGIFSRTLFAVSRNGILFAIDTNSAGINGGPAIFANIQQVAFDTNNDGAADAVTVGTGQTDVTGLAFSPLDFNLWHLTGLRGDDQGHGVNSAPDGSRGATRGGQSLYFVLKATRMVSVLVLRMICSAIL